MDNTGDNRIQVNLYDAENDKIYTVWLSSEDSMRCDADPEFGQMLLQYAQREEKEKIECHDNEENNMSQPGMSAEQDNTWSFNETLVLITAYDNHKENFNVVKKRKYVWQDIANEMQSNGFSKTAEKCETKWRNLLRTYKNVKDISKSTGRGAGKFKFFEQMDEILGDKPSTSATHTFSTTKQVMQEKEEKISEIEDKEDSVNELDKKTSKEKNGSLEKFTPKRKRIEKLDEKLKRKSEDLMTLKISYLKKKEDEEKNKELRRQKKIELKEKMLEIEERKVALLEKYLEKENSK